MVKKIEDKTEKYDVLKDADLYKQVVPDIKDAARIKLFDKGMSKRIWEELYKVIDSSDVLIYVLDARNPNGTRSKFLEDYLKKNCPNKHLVLVLNKCDLIPSGMVQRWVKYL